MLISGMLGAFLNEKSQLIILQFPVQSEDEQVFGSCFNKKKTFEEGGCNSVKKSHEESEAETLNRLTSKDRFQTALNGDEACRDGTSADYSAKECNLTGKKDENVCSITSALKTDEVIFTLYYLF